MSKLKYLHVEIFLGFQALCAADVRDNLFGKERKRRDRSVWQTECEH